MAPEYLQQVPPIDHRQHPHTAVQDTAGYNELVDIYSVGILALETFTGRNPYAGMSNLHV